MLLELSMLLKRRGTLLHLLLMYLRLLVALRLKLTVFLRLKLIVLLLLKLIVLLLLQRQNALLLVIDDAGVWAAHLLKLWPGCNRLLRDLYMGSDDQCGTFFVFAEELLPILGRLLVKLDLCGLGRRVSLVHRGKFIGGGSRLDAAASTVIADTVIDDCVVDRHVMDVGVVNIRHIDAIDGAVVVEIVAVPIAATVAGAGVAIAIVNTSIEADVQTPEAAMKAIPVAIVPPVAGCPEGAIEGWRGPRSGDPEVASRHIAPVAGCPEIVRLRAGRLLIEKQRWWRFRSLLGGVLGVLINGLIIVLIARLIARIAIVLSVVLVRIVLIRVAVTPVVLVLIALRGRRVVGRVGSMLYRRGTLLVDRGLLLTFIHLTRAENAVACRLAASRVGSWLVGPCILTGLAGLTELAELTGLTGVWELRRLVGVDRSEVYISGIRR